MVNIFRYQVTIDYIRRKWHRSKLLSKRKSIRGDGVWTCNQMMSSRLTFSQRTESLDIKDAQSQGETASEILTAFMDSGRRNGRKIMKVMKNKKMLRSDARGSMQAFKISGQRAMLTHSCSFGFIIRFSDQQSWNGHLGWLPQRGIINQAVLWHNCRQFSPDWKCRRGAKSIPRTSSVRCC